MTAGDWSVPETEVMDTIADVITDGTAVLATIVGVAGSAYRRPGAKMIIADQSEGVGSITAGCLEDEVLSIAESVRDDGEPRTERFDLTGEDDVWGLGVGCNGVIDILVEPLDEQYRPIVNAYQRGDDITVLTVVDSDVDNVACGDRAIVDPLAEVRDSDNVVSKTAGWPDWLLESVEETSRRLLADNTSDTVVVEHDGKRIELFIDSVTGPPHLVIFGSGHDVAPVAQLATQVDFEVTVVSFRGSNAVPERFPAADTVVSTSPATIRDTIDFDSDTYTVVMSHNFLDDRIALAELLETPTEYIGLMGPRERFEEMRDDLVDEGRTFTDDELDRIYTPAGLDLGGGTPYHIAQSIVAEVTTVYHDREPKHLKERDGSIHRRSPIDTSTNE